MDDDREARALLHDVAIGRVVDAAQVDRLLEAELGMVAQGLRSGRPVGGGHDDGDLAERDGEAGDPARKRCRQRGLQTFEPGRHQRAIVLVRQILFCSCMMP